MGWFRRSTNDPAELDRVKTEIAALRSTLEAHDERQREAASSSALASPAGGEDATPTAPAAYDDAAVTARLDELAAKLGELDARITAVSTELANQVTELGDDIEALAARPAGDGGGEVVLGELRDGQSRLANEQARYQIAFREDLARLAEQVRRPGTNG